MVNKRKELGMHKLRAAVAMLTKEQKVDIILFIIVKRLPKLTY